MLSGIVKFLETENDGYGMGNYCLMEVWEDEILLEMYGGMIAQQCECI